MSNRLVRTDSEPPWLIPDWPAPVGINALSTLRYGGVSQPPWADFNLAEHVGDDPHAVAENRRRLRRQAALPAEPFWLHQVHGARVVDAALLRGTCKADGAFSRQAGVVCAVLTADCLPLLLCDRAGQRVAAVHCGWRGLAAGIVEAAVAALSCDAGQLMAWLGPAIGPAYFEVGAELRKVFVDADVAAVTAFFPVRAGHWLADIYKLARQRLQNVGVREISGGHWCTVSEAEQFFSYRREGCTGRMVTLIWLRN